MEFLENTKNKHKTLSLHYKKLSLDLLNSGKNKARVECCPVSSWEDKHESSEDGKQSIICSPKMLEVVEGSLQEISSALECSWNTHLKQMAKSREAAYNLLSAAACEIHTGLSADKKHATAGSTQPCMTAHSWMI